jgi:hypothetical protein
VTPQLIDPYIQWKHTRSPRDPPNSSAGSELLWNIQVLHLEGAYLDFYASSYYSRRIIAKKTRAQQVTQWADENVNVALMRHGLIAGTPVRPSIAFSVDLLDYYYCLRRRQPSIGIQGCIKATCTFLQVLRFVVFRTQFVLLTSALSLHTCMAWRRFLRRHLIFTPKYNGPSRRKLTLRSVEVSRTGV